MTRALAVAETKPVYPLALYGSGDKGSAELRALLDARKLPYMFHDIRANVGALKRLIQFGHDTVPQLYNGDSAHLGGCSHALAWVKLQNAR